MQDTFKINNVPISPGRKITVNVPVAKLHTHTDMTMPVHVVRGKKDGPRLFVSAAMHGDEILGVEIVRRLITYKILKRLRGTLITVPVVNVFGFINHSRHLPDGRDLNRFFPGNKVGSLASRLARIFMEEVVAPSTHGIDLHTGSHHRVNLPQIRANLEDPLTRSLAESFGVPVIIDANVRDGSLRQAVMEKGVPMLLYEAGEAFRFDEIAILTGIRGILAVMRRIGMLPDVNPKPSKIKSLVALSTIWVRASKSGILRTKVLLGDRVNQKDQMGIVADPFGENQENIYSPATGIVIGRTNMPLIHEGDAIFHIARLDPDAPDAMVESTLQEFQDEMNRQASEI